MFINLTPHTIRVIDMDNVVHEITPSGTVARVETVDEEGDPIVVDGAKFSVKSRTMGAVSDLPEPNGTSIFLVSSMVLDGVQGRQDVFAPDTGRTAIRDGRLVWAVVNLIECMGEVDPDPEFEGGRMKAHILSILLKFRGDRPGLVLRDHETGHISVFRCNEHVATAGPGSLLALQQEAYLMSICGNHEIRGSWYAIARAMSILQQTGDWDEAYTEAQAVTDFEAEYGI